MTQSNTTYTGKTFEPKIDSEDGFIYLFKANSDVKYNRFTDSHFVNGVELTYSKKTGKLLFEFKKSLSTYIIDQNYNERD